MRRLLTVFVLGLVFTIPSVADACVHCVAKQKAQIAANRLIRGHVGGSLGGARYEGVGWGSTPQAALSKCCYSGRRPMVAQAVARGRDGNYYAVRLFR
jgi:hypothetical protein